MKYFKQVAAPVGAFLALTLLISVLAAPYFREAERESAPPPPSHYAQSTARMQ